MITGTSLEVDAGMERSVVSSRCSDMAGPSEGQLGSGCSLSGVGRPEGEQWAWVVIGTVLFGIFCWILKGYGVFNRGRETEDEACRSLPRVGGLEGIGGRGENDGMVAVGSISQRILPTLIEVAPLLKLCLPEDAILEGENVNEDAGNNRSVWLFD